MLITARRSSLLITARRSSMLMTIRRLSILVVDGIILLPILIRLLGKSPVYSYKSLEGKILGLFYSYSIILYYYY